MIRFDNSYARLPEHFFVRVAPEPVAAPRLLALNAALAAEMGLDARLLATPEGVAMLAGNHIPEGAEPIAQAYAGHQFGGFVPRLGDGRAVMLGEVVGPDGAHWDIQLKGSGRTPFSRGGDGRAWLGPVLREFLVSEAMAALGVPTTRALAAVATGEDVWRDGRMPGAVLTRVAPSHIRVGTFQYFAARQDAEALGTLTAFAIARHYPQAEGPLGLLEAAVAAQARLIAQWMALGFIHGVMNTDNCHVGGITIDYGPCAFMDDFHPGQVFSSIDRGGRYAWGNQPQIAAWNLAQFATCLLPLIDPDRDRAIERATAAFHRFGPLWQEAWAARLGAKIGLGPEGADLGQALLDRMAETGADFTVTFRTLAEGGPLPEGLAAWEADWRAELGRRGIAPEAAQAMMRRTNPAIIPRNHRIEAAIAAAVAGDAGPFERLRRALATPWEVAPEDDDLRARPAAHEVVHATFCGT
ncbi:MAG: protein adenylyltransferase SelO [Gemmobacter sp.]